MKAGSALRIKRGADLSLSGEDLGRILAGVLEKSVPFRFKAKGLSMAPFIKDGDVLTVSPLPRRGPRTGDVVAFLHPVTGKVAVHRIVRRASGVLILKGDNAPEADAPLPAGCSLGKVTRVERSGKDVRLGTGPGRAAVALFSRARLLEPVLKWVRRAGRREGRGS